MQHDNELARARSEQLASVRLLEQAEAREQSTAIELTALKEECAALREEVKDLLKGSVKLEVSSPPTVVKAEDKTPDRESSSDENSDEGSTISQASGRQSHKANQHPPGFKEIRSRVDKFTGKQAEEDFELWFTDFEEATSAYGWSDDQKAGWFSWFISGPAKATWQRTLTAEQKTSWETIVQTFRGQYGIHLDPRVAYQRCHELQYERYGSAQGLLNAMRDFQRMAPEKLTDNILESILRNKVPVELQQEVKEISGSVQELLQKLLRAESVLLNGNDVPVNLGQQIGRIRT